MKRRVLVRLFRIALFEMKYVVTSIHFTLATLMFFGLGFLLTANAGEFLSFSGGEVVLANSPFTITHMLIRLSMLSAFIAPTLIANSILKDCDCRFDSILFSTPINEKDYLHGRFLGSFVCFSICFFAAPLGMYLGAFWPWADQSLLGDNQFSTYLQVYLTILLPSLLVVSTFAFSTAVITRSLVYSYIGVIALLGLFFVTSFSETLPVDLDPFMLDRYLEQTQFLTSKELNQQVTPIKGAVLSNRLGWIIISIVLYFIAVWNFSFAKLIVDKSVKLKKNIAKDSTEIFNQLSSMESSSNRNGKTLDSDWRPKWDRQTAIYQLKKLSWFEMSAVLKSVPFIILLVFSMSIMLIDLNQREIVHGVLSLPLTSVLLNSFSNLTPAVLAVIVFYSADIMWRERNSSACQVIDPMPVANRIFVVSKLLALILILVIIKFLGIVLSIAVQLANNYYLFEFDLYFLREFIYQLIPFVCLAILACLFHVIAKTRLIGMMLFGLFIAMVAVSRDMLGWEHPILSFGIPAVAAPMSDMNGNYAFIELGVWMRVYWMAMAGLFLMLIYSLWPRGNHQSLKHRLQSLVKQKTPKSNLGFGLLCSILVGSASFIYYNTNILNHFLTKLEREQVQAEYETKFIAYTQLPMPKITKVNSKVELFPNSRKLVVNSVLTLMNKTEQVINTVHFSFPVESTVSKAELENATLKTKDKKFKYYIFDLIRPLAPGETINFEYSLQTQSVGFSGGHHNTSVVSNGSFVMSTHTQPAIGLQMDYFLKDNRIRKNYGLPDIKRRADWRDTSQFENNVIRTDSDFIEFETIVSTINGQTAIALGDLVNQWSNEERAFFHYKSRVPLVNFPGYLSADYQVVEETWKGITMQVYHYPQHHQNIERIMMGMRDSLEYYTEAFGAYPHKHIRVVEFPGYKTFAKAFPSTIAFSESFGFSADVTEQGLDMPYYIVAHEMAHQWWGNQVIAANVEGDGFIHESFAQYSALMVMEKRYGKAKLREFLLFERERYLEGRARDPRGENPLLKVASQKHIHYGKGALVLYALKQKIGEEKLNDIFKQFFQQRAFSSKPYATSLDFIALLRNNIEERYHPLVVDLFEKITLYDLEIIDALVTPLEDGRFQVTVDVEIRKLYADKFGEETVQPFDDEIEIGLFSASLSSDRFSEQHILQMETVKVSSEKTQLKMIVTERPKFVAIDPFFHFIERERENNVMSLSE